MRPIGSVKDRHQADLFSKYLVASGIASQVEEADGQWTVWVREEDQLETSRDELDAFLANPDNPKYQAVASDAARVREAEQRRRTAASRNTIDVRREVWNQPLTRRAPLTMAIIGVCVLLSLLSLVLPPAWYQRLQGALIFSDIYGDPAAVMAGDYWSGIRHGQIWRLVTPVFLHGGLPHLVFNMLCLYALGGQIEVRLGSRLLAVVALASAMAANLGQLSFTGPSFVGMSGVVYGLFGFSWIRMIVAPGDGLRISRETIGILIGWLVLGFVGVLDRALGISIGNESHLFGMVMGIVLALVMPRRRS
jgi:GlpG protein